MRITRLIFFSLFFANIVTGAFSQQRNYKVFTESDGLPSSTIYSIKQDSKGYIWISTDQGVSRYDGYEFTNFGVADGLSDSEVFDTFEDSQGRIWFYTLNGKVSYYLQGKFYSSKNDSTLKPLDSESMITSVFEDKNENIWISSFNNGVIVRNQSGKSSRYLSNSKGIIGFIKLPNSGFWTLNSDRFVSYSIENNDFQKVKEICLPECIDFSRSKYIVKSSIEVWFINVGAVYSINIKTNSIKKVFGNKYSGNRIYNICKTNNEIWLCTHKGLLKYTKDQFHEYCSISESSTILKDKEENYWFGTLNRAIKYQYRNAIFYLDNNSDFSEQRIIQITADSSNRKWLLFKGDNFGFIQNHELKKVKIQKSIRPSYNGKNRKLVFLDHGIFLAADEGLYFLEGNEHSILQVTSKDLVIGMDNNLWLGSNDGLYNLSLNDFHKNKEFERNSLSHMSKFLVLKRRINNIFLDSEKRLWVNSANEVLIKENETNQFKRLKVLNGYKVNDFANFQDNSTLLATNNNGLIYFSNDSMSIIDVNFGLSSNRCNSVTVDKYSNIWLSTNSGINKINGFPDDLKIEYITNAEGLTSNVINDVLVNNDTVWVVTEKGINYFKHSNYRSINSPPSIQIEEVISTDQRKASNNKKYVFQYDNNNILVKYIGINSAWDENIEYRFKTSTTDSWQRTRNRSVNFTSLDAGDYNFVVEAKSKNSVWSKPASIRFRILKPYWKTNLFRASVIILAVCIIGIIIYATIKSKQQQIVQQQKMVLSELKSLKAQMNPHFLFNALNSIQGELLSNQPEIARNYLVKLSRLMRQVLEHSENVYVSVEEEIEIIKNYLEIEKYKTSNRFDFELSISPEIDQSYEQIPSMLVQPFLENSIWHGFVEKSQRYFLKILLNRAEGGGIEVNIIDNGIGRQKAASITQKTHKSKGMKLIFERIEALNFGKEHKITLSVDDLDDNHGTNVQLLVPIQYTNEYYN